MEEIYEITRLAAADGGEGVCATVRHGDESEKLTLSVADYTALAPEKGEIPEEAYRALLAADGRYRAVRAALRLLGNGQCSRKKLCEKLRARHFSAGDAVFAADFAVKNGYLDEQWQLLSYLKLLMGKKQYGPRKIFPYLCARGYAAADIRAVLAEKVSEDDLAAAKTTFLVKMFGKETPETEEEAKAMKSALYKQGW